ncbi:MAG: hypothetical protein QOG10_5297 [Kribbellaceae bacterium]|jgi:hypothetical protein|nr:hypothetical protein [Kribbellaceae bacterium]
MPESTSVREGALDGLRRHPALLGEHTTQVLAEEVP